MGMMINRRRACGGKSLPYDAEIEYLSNVSGGVYFLTDIIPDGHTTFECQYNVEYINKSSKFLHLYMQVDWGKGRGLRLQRDGNVPDSYYRWFNSSESLIPARISGKHIAKDAPDGLYHDGTKIKSSNAYSGSYNKPMRLFYAITDDTRVRFYYLKIFQNNTMIAHFVPVRIGQDGYLYDNIRGNLLANGGSGSLILGPDVN